MTPGPDNEVGVRLRVKDQRRFNSEMKKSGKTLDDFGLAADRADKKGRRGGKGMMAGAVGAGAITRAANVGALALGGMGAAAIRVGVDFDKKMAQVKAVSGATGAEFTSLRNLAIDMGAKTKYSAGESAEAMYELSSAGIKTSQMGSTLRGTLGLAAASGIELADAAEIQANALGGFGLAGNQATHVADVLAQSTADSSIKMRDLQYSLKYIGPIARATGQSFETMVAALAIMGNAGIKGEQAGTTLRGALTRLTNPTKSVTAGLDQMGLKISDLQGPKGLKPLPRILDIMRKKTAGMSAAQRNQAIASTFGTEALSGMQALLNAQPGEYDKLIKRYKDADGNAGRMAKTMNDTVAGAFDQARGSAETLGIKLYDVASPTIKAGLLLLTDGINFLGAHSKATTYAIAALAGIVTGLYVARGLIAVYRGVGNALAFLRGLCIATRIQLALLRLQMIASRVAAIALRVALFAQRAAMVAWQGAILLSRGAMLLWRGTLIALRVAMIAFRATLVAMRAAVLLFNTALMANPIGLIVIGIIALGAALVLAYKKVGWFRAAVDAAFKWLKTAVVAVVNFYKAYWTAAFNLIKSVTVGAINFIIGVWRRIIGAVRAVASFIRSYWSAVFRIVRTVVSAAIGAIVAHFNRVRGAVSAVVNFVKSAFNGLVGALRGVAGRLSGALHGAWNGLKSGFKSAINWVIQRWNNLEFGMESKKIAGETVVPGFKVGTPDIPMLAKGGTFQTTGAAIVGEAGPELLTNVPVGAQVTPLSDSAPRARVPRMASAATSGDYDRGGDYQEQDMTPHFHLYIGGKEVAVAVRKEAGDAGARQ